jgi:uncharacterized integral membrane protein (TIGR00697 family)
MKNYKFILPLVMVYTTIKISSILLMYKIVVIDGYSVSAATLLLPLWFFIGDIIAEVYGYKNARNILFIVVFCQILFALICSLFAQPSLNNILANQDSYSNVLGVLPRAALASVVAILLSSLFNAYFIDKYKKKYKGKYFGLRTIVITSIGELIFTLCTFVIVFFNVVSLIKVVPLMVFAYLVKIIINPILILPISYITKIIKKYESMPFDPLTTNMHLTELYTGDDNKSYFRQI